ncbi:MAG: class II fumarate hydratase [Thaumarchaeota archaeon]|nr:MAG: class II fumarate hydratase [Nitrososphaerota archaeon]
MKYVEGSKRVFLDTGTRFQRKIVWAIGTIKVASARTNVSLGLLDRPTGEAIVKAGEEVVRGKFDDSVVVDVFQTGSGTGINMNVNELIAEEASRLLGRKVHPNDHVNMGQSSNDVGSSTMRVAAVSAVWEELMPALRQTISSLTRLSRKTSGVYKAGRTHLRDALPVTMGQEFGAYADAFREDLKGVTSAAAYASELPMGGTAVGTGLNTDPRFGTMVAVEISRTTGLKFVKARNTFRATRLLTDLASLSGGLRSVALDLYRLCQDLRLMFSGPITGLGEIDIPTQEEVAGSSIMPGKTNPVTVESALLASAQVMGLDEANKVAAMLGEFELSMGVPLMGYNLVSQIRLLVEALLKLSTVVLDHVSPRKGRSRRFAESSPALVTVISPKIGYDKAAAIGKKLEGGLSIREALKEIGYGEKEIDKILDLKRLVRPGIPIREIAK